MMRPPSPDPGISFKLSPRSSAKRWPTPSRPLDTAGAGIAATCATGQVQELEPVQVPLRVPEPKQVPEPGFFRRRIRSGFGEKIRSPPLSPEDAQHAVHGQCLLFPRQCGARLRPGRTQFHGGFVGFNLGEQLTAFHLVANFFVPLSDTPSVIVSLSLGMRMISAMSVVHKG